MALHETVVVVGNGQNLGAEWNGQAGEIVRKAGAVPHFVVVSHQLAYRLELADGRQRCLSAFGVADVDAALFRFEGVVGFAEQLVRQSDLADVVEQAGEHDVLRRGVVQAGGFCQLAGMLRDPAAVARHVAAAHLDQIAEHAHRGEKVLLERFVGFLDLADGRLQIAGTRKDARLQFGVHAFELGVLLCRERVESHHLCLQASAVDRVLYRAQDLLIFPRLVEIA